VIAAAVLLAYANSFGGPFIFDDVPVIRDNPTIRHLWPPWVPLSPPPGMGVSGRPLLNLSFALSYALGGMNPWAYHAVNLCVHLLAALALFGVVRRTPFAGNTTATAAAVALVWALHPLQTGAVTYIAERSESIMGLFYLLTLYCFIRHSAAKDGTRIGFGILAVACCLLGGCAKEVMATAFAAVLLYDRTFVSGSFGAALRRQWPVHLALLLACLWTVANTLGNGLGDLGIGAGLGISPWTYALLESKVILRYLGLALWPAGLALDYGPAVGVRAADLWPWALPLLALAAAALTALWKRPALGFAACWFFLVLAPTSSVVPLPLQPMAESRMYLPLAGLAAIAVAGLGAALRGRRPVFLAVVGLAALGLGGMTVARNADYRSEIGIWRDCVAKQPENSRAQYNLGCLLLKDGRTQEAIDHLEESLRLYPYLSDAQFSVGLAYADMGRLPEAIAAYTEALRLKPHFAKAQVNCGIALAQVGRLPEALPHFEAAVRLDPGMAEARENLGMALLESGRVPEAVVQLQESARLRPGSAELLNRLGIALAEAGRLPEAAEQLGEALRINPRSSQTHVNLGSVLANENRMEEAAAEYVEALRIDPGAADTHSRLGTALRALGRTAEADAQFAEAAQLKVIAR